MIGQDGSTAVLPDCRFPWYRVYKWDAGIELNHAEQYIDGYLFNETHWHKRRYGLVNMHGEIITDAVWIKPDCSSCSEGDHIVVQMIDGERKLGYLDNSGTLAVPCIFDDASDFENGLAFVRIGSRCGYIDKDGQEVYFWESEEEPDFNESDEEE